jgi:hypothetical protein
MIEDDPDERWRDCRVIDVSSLGVGLELTDVTAQEAAGRNIILASNLRGTVRHSVPSRGPGIRVGVEFVDRSEDDETYVTSLVKLHAHW